MNTPPVRKEPDDEAVLAALKQADAFVTGQELGRRASMSTERVVAAVGELQAQGYQIVARPDSGYRLIGAPDALLPAELTDGLTTRVVGSHVVCYEETDSTMDVARRLADAGAREGTCVFAESQARGRGRFGRTWVSPRRGGVYVSIVLTPAVATAEASQMTLLSAVAVADAVHNVTGLPARLKWPNDVMIHDRKIAGVLTEVKAHHDRLAYVIVGIGLNVNMPLRGLPERASSLSREAGGDVDRLRLCRVLLTCMDSWYDTYRQKGFDSIKEAWVARSATLGRYVQIETSVRRIEGQAVTLDALGGLVVRRQDGFTESVLAGDVVRLR